MYSFYSFSKKYPFLDIFFLNFYFVIYKLLRKSGTIGKRWTNKLGGGE